jgi:hypothetical protein
LDKPRNKPIDKVSCCSPGEPIEITGAATADRHSVSRMTGSLKRCKAVAVMRRFHRGEPNNPGLSIIRMIGLLTGEAKKAREVSKLARVKLIFPFTKLRIADTCIASALQATSE